MDSSGKNSSYSYRSLDRENPAQRPRRDLQLPDELPSDEQNEKGI